MNAFSVSGPFASIEEMTFPEKKQADLVLDVEINYEWNKPAWQIQEHHSSWDGSTWNTYAVDDNLQLSGLIKVTLFEPLSGQRMWSKDIPVSDETARVVVPETKFVELANRIVLNAGGALLEATFEETLRQVERYFHPDEVRLVKTQAQELREKKVY